MHLVSRAARETTLLPLYIRYVYATVCFRSNPEKTTGKGAPPLIVFVAKDPDEGQYIHVIIQEKL